MDNKFIKDIIYEHLSNIINTVIFMEQFTILHNLHNLLYVNFTPWDSEKILTVRPFTNYIENDDMPAIICLRFAFDNKPAILHLIVFTPSKLSQSGEFEFK